MTTRPLASDRELAIHGRIGVGRFVRDHREALGMSAMELAGLVGVSGPFLCGIEGGSVSLPAMRGADFARALAVDAREFGLVLLSFQNPYLFAMIFPNATAEPLTVTDEDIKLIERILERRALQRTTQRKATRRWQ